MQTNLPSSIILSLLLHAVVASVVGTAFVSCTSPIDSQAKVEQAKAIEATVLTEEEAMAYYEHKRAQEEERQRILSQQRAAEQKRKELERKRKAQQIELQRRKEVERKRKAEQLRLEKQRAAERKAKQEAEEEQRRAEEHAKALQEARKREQERRAEEEARRQAELKRLKVEHQQQLRMRKRQLSQWTKQYASTLRRSVEAQWKKPPTSIKGGDCIVRVRQQNDGVVTDVRIVSCDGDKLYRSSVIEAVWKANPLPLPPVEDVFDSEIELTFRKEYGG